MGTDHGQESTHDVGTPEIGAPTPADKTDNTTGFRNVLDHLGMATALVETATHALEAAENDDKCTAIGSEIATLQQAVVSLGAVHEELDHAIVRAEVRS